MRSVVVLPAPFGPRKPVTEPGSTVKLSRSTARTLPPKTLLRSSTTMRAGCGARTEVTGSSQPDHVEMARRRAVKAIANVPSALVEIRGIAIVRLAVA